jgi:hypothetical protein
MDVGSRYSVYGWKQTGRPRRSVGQPRESPPEDNMAAVFDHLLDAIALVGDRGRTDGCNGCSGERLGRSQYGVEPAGSIKVHVVHIGYNHCGAGPGGRPSHLTTTAEVLLSIVMAVTAGTGPAPKDDHAGLDNRLSFRSRAGRVP